MRTSVTLAELGRVAGQWLYDWQTLAAGILALFAAIWAGILLQRQIRQSEDHRRDDVQRRHNAARLTMPLALAKISQLVQSIADQIAGELETFEPHSQARDIAETFGNGPRKFEPVELSDDVVANFRRFVETLTERNDIKHTAELISQIQILIARFNSLDLQGAGVRSNLEDRLVDAAKARLLCDKMYDYARSVTHESFGIVGVISNEAAWQEIAKKAYGLVFLREYPDAFSPAIQDHVTRARERDLSPWIKRFKL
jgi:hypothetical protein